MIRRVHLTDEDLEISEEACRALADRYRQDAERQNNPLIRDWMLKNAAKFDRMAERIKLARDAR